MKTYKIPITWTLWDRIEVDADNLQEALKIALKQFLDTPSTDGDFLDDSYEIDEDDIREEYPNEEFDLDKVKQEL